MKSGVYKIVCIINGKFYIGRAVDLKQRWAVHSSHLRLNKHTNILLQNAWNKYGSENFVFEIVEYVEKERLVEREQHWIDNSKCCDKSIGFNLNPSAENSAGFKHSPETVEKIRQNTIRLGLKPPSPLGRIHKPESIAKMSAAHMGKPKSEKHKANMRGKIRSPEHCANIAKSREGFTHNAETRAKISAAGREPDKWPHPDGNKCKCRECRDKINAYYREKNLLARRAKGSGPSRKIDKWPHEKGSLCTCNECRKKRNIEDLARKHKRKNNKIGVEILKEQVIDGSI